MTRGYFIDSEGVPVYRGTYGDKPALHAGHGFVAEAVARQRPSDRHAWNGTNWIVSPRLEAAEQRRQAHDELARLDAALPRALEDVIEALAARGVLTEADLPQAARDRLAAKRSLREVLI